MSALPVKGAYFKVQSQEKSSVFYIIISKWMMNENRIT